MNDPADIFALAVGGMQLRHMRRLQALGVSADCLTGARPLAGVLPITPSRSGTFEAAEDGRNAVIVPAGYSYGRPWWYRLDDLIAFYPDTPGRWWTMHDAVDMLGEEYREDAYAADREAVLVATPLDWLRWAGNAACIVNWGADPRTLFHGFRTVECATDDVALRLRQRIEELSRPTYRIAVARRQKAAA